MLFDQKHQAFAALKFAQAGRSRLRHYEDIPNFKKKKILQNLDTFLNIAAVCDLWEMSATKLRVKFS